jgi:ubiquinone/menaquinone biosynthesis C-methylase UbiE
VPPVQRTENLAHWEAWAAEHGTELRATTKCVSIKRLEIEALIRQLQRRLATPAPLVLEVGCGNGVNGFALTSRHPTLRYVGIDFSPKMIENAVRTVERRKGQGDEAVARMAFGVADARLLARPFVLDRGGPHVVGSVVADALAAPAIDAVFTDRMLINLASADEQLAVMARIASVLEPGGFYLMLENSRQTHAALNDVRQALGLPKRPAADYNIFIDEPTVVAPFQKTMALAEVEDFSALHDLLLYAIGPALEDGQVQYDTPLMTKVADASLALAQLGLGTGAFGQNRLWIWKKP